MTLELAETKDDHAVWKWVAKLPKETEFTLGDHVMRGALKLKEDTKDYGQVVGLIHEDWDKGMLGGLSPDGAFTIVFRREQILNDDGNFSEASTEVLNGELGLDPPGLGNTWG